MELAIKELQIVDLDIEDYRNQERIINNDLSYYPGPDTSDLSRGNKKYKIDYSKGLFSK